jgi:methionyl-tRNA synthetase
MFQQLGVEPVVSIPDVWEVGAVQPSHVIGEPKLLFHAIPASKVEEWRESFGGEEARRQKEEEQRKAAEKKAAKEREKERKRQKKEQEKKEKTAASGTGNQDTDGKAGGSGGSGGSGVPPDQVGDITASMGKTSI